MNTPVFSTSTNGYTLILGLGETGLAAAHWYLRQALPVRLADTRLGYQAHIDELCSHYAVAAVEVVLGGEALALSVLDSVQTVVISPGLAITDAAIVALLAAAQERNIRVVSEIELFAQALIDLSHQAAYSPKLLAVTGTNGKTTVSQMVKHMVAETGQRVVVAGNISPAALTALMQALDDENLPEVWVIELSSFQLVHTYSLPVLAGVVLNVSQDHLDWHGGMSAYVAAKAQLFRMCQQLVFNRNDTKTKELISGFETKLTYSFGTDPALNTGDLGVVEYQGQKWISTTEEYLLPVAALLVVGKHNLSNALAALALARAAGIAWEPAIAILRSYYGEPHRCQLVRNISGIDFINDSKGTNVAATIAAVEGVSRPFVLIAGGVAKDQDFSSLAAALSAGVCRAVVLIGQDAQYIAQYLDAIEAPIYFAESLKDAVNQAVLNALEGDVVLLSPACASLDMFANYVERGYCFVDIVTELALDQGGL